jgi:tripeptide aminopeptidase
MMSLGIPAVTIGGGGEGGNWHSRNEWYRPIDAWYGRQNALLTILVLTGLDGVTKPALVVRPGNRVDRKSCRSSA